MKFYSRKEKGFSLIEVMMVVTIAGLLAAVAVPSMIGSKDAAENIAVFSNLRAMHTNQIVHRSAKGRFARLKELNSFSGNIFGSVNGSTLTHKNWVYMMTPTPTDASLRSSYQIVALRLRNGRINAAYVVAQDGTVQPWVSPLPPGDPAPTPRPPAGGTSSTK